jgi:hypothetical protein
MRISKIYAPKLREIVKYVPYIIYDLYKTDVEISVPIKNICVHQKIGAQTLTIWARQNLQLLPSLAEELSFR